VEPTIGWLTCSGLGEVALCKRTPGAGLQVPLEHARGSFGREFHRAIGVPDLPALPSRPLRTGHDAPVIVNGRATPVMMTVTAAFVL
jgi:hypothetical protein